MQLMVFKPDFGLMRGKEKSTRTETEGEQERIPLTIRTHPERKTTLFGVGQEEGIRCADSIRDYAEENGFTQKHEFHVTFIRTGIVRTIEAAIADQQPEQQRQHWAAIDELLQSIDWKITERGSLYHVKVVFEYPDRNDETETIRDERESIVQAVDIPHFEDVLQQLAQKYNFEYEAPFPHITLFTKGNIPEKAKYGISIYGKDHLEQLDPECIDSQR